MRHKNEGANITGIHSLGQNGPLELAVEKP